MKVKFINTDFKSQEKFFKLLTPRNDNYQKAFVEILYPEKKQIPFSTEIQKRTRIVSDLNNGIERIYIKNEDYFKKINELKINKNSYSNEKNKLTKKRINPKVFYKFIKKNISNYYNHTKKKEHLKSRNNKYPFLKPNLTSTEFNN